MIFASHELVFRIERAEAQSLEHTVVGGGPGVFVKRIGGGVALYRAEASPLNKVCGLGGSEIDVAQLAEIEALYAERAAPVQIELATHADPAIAQLLIARGYHLTGYENVSGRALDSSVRVPALPAGLEVRRAADTETEAWIDVLVEGFGQLAPGEKAEEHDAFDRTSLERVFRDMAEDGSLERWVALLEGKVVGSATMNTSTGILQLFGAATHPSARRRGVQSALLGARLHAGRRAGCELAVVTTQPGGKSQHNVLRAGFSILYARAVWLRPHR